MRAQKARQVGYSKEYICPGCQRVMGAYSDGKALMCVYDDCGFKNVRYMKPPRGCHYDTLWILPNVTEAQES